jgi:hypothetical protein
MMSTLRQWEANRAASLLPWGRFRCPAPDIKPEICGIQHSLENHEGKGVQIVGKRDIARWRLNEVTN